MRLPEARHGQDSFLWASTVMVLQAHRFTSRPSVMSQLWRAPVQACKTNLQLRQELKLARKMLPGCARGSATRCDALQATSASVKCRAGPHGSCHAHSRSAASAKGHSLVQRLACGLCAVTSQSFVRSLTQVLIGIHPALNYIANHFSHCIAHSLLSIQGNCFPRRLQSA